MIDAQAMALQTAREQLLGEKVSYGAAPITSIPITEVNTWLLRRRSYPVKKIYIYPNSYKNLDYMSQCFLQVVRHCSALIMQCISRVEPAHTQSALAACYARRVFSHAQPE